MRPVGIILGGEPAARKRMENLIEVGVPLAGTLALPFWLYEHSLTRVEVSAFIVSHIVIGLGITLGLHRYFTHRSFSAGPVFRAVLAAVGSMAFQGSILRWVADHRRHHAHPDSCGDLHSPLLDAHCSTVSTLRGFFHAHIGWLFDDVTTDYSIYARDLLDDKLIMFFHRTYWVWLALSLLVPYGYGYWLGGLDTAFGSLLFGGCLRTVLIQHFTWSVNSVCHSFGTEAFKQDNHSKNNLLVALLTFGEGWHNNHHRFPRSAFHGLEPSQPDMTGWVIAALEKLGIVSDVLRAPPATLFASPTTLNDGTASQ
jgi:stearoyl-CoA desaturase (delta-9 desaturase)